MSPYICSLLVYVLFSLLVGSAAAGSSEPLLLTPLVKCGAITKAQVLAETKPPLLKGVRSYSGYLTADETHGSQMFFWFFPRTKNWLNAPLLLWLQGGPGASSMYALFTENGPFQFRKGKLRRRRYSWGDHFNLLYIDNPVGTGFSFTQSGHGYATNQTAVANNLHETLRQFLLLFPELQKNDVILSGESYAGKYLPALASVILHKKSTTSPAIKVFGIFMGNPWISVEHMLPHYSEYLYSHGFLDSKGRQVFRQNEEEILTAIYSKRWVEAADLLADTFFEDYNGQKKTLLYNLTGLPNHYNMQKNIADSSDYVKFLKKNKTKSTLHVGDYEFNKTSRKVFDILKGDIMKSTKSVLEEVLENYRVLIYSGQWDIICPYYVNEFLFRELSHSGAYDYYQSQRKPFYYRKDLAGYYKVGKNFADVLIRNAGHMTPADKPRWVLGLLKKFAYGMFHNSTTS